MNKEIAKQNSKDNLWLLRHFVDLTAYIEKSLKIVSMICVLKDNMPLEKYDNIGFLFDLFDYQINIGERILATYDDATVKQFLPGGINTVKAVIQKLKDRKMNDFLKFSDSFDDVNDSGDLSKRDLQDRIFKMAKKEDKAAPNKEKKK